MKKRLPLILVCLLVVWTTAHSNNIQTHDEAYPYHWNKNWQNPSPLTYAYKQGDNMVVFHGIMTLDGILYASWRDNTDLILSFYPDQKSRNILPFVADDYHDTHIAIILNESYLDKPITFNEDDDIISTHQSLPDNEQLIRSAFTEIPASFWQTRTGEVSWPSRITINAFAMDFECDSRQYYATVIGVQSLDKTNASTTEGC